MARGCAKVHAVGDNVTPQDRGSGQAVGAARKWSLPEYRVGHDGCLIASYGGTTSADAGAVLTTIERPLDTLRPAAF